MVPTLSFPDKPPPSRVWGEGGSGGEVRVRVCVEDMCVSVQW